MRSQYLRILKTHELPGLANRGYAVVEYRDLPKTLDFVCVECGMGWRGEVPPSGLVECPHCRTTHRLQKRIWMTPEKKARRST